MCLLWCLFRWARCWYDSCTILQGKYLAHTSLQTKKARILKDQIVFETKELSRPMWFSDQGTVEASWPWVHPVRRPPGAPTPPPLLHLILCTCTCSPAPALPLQHLLTRLPTTLLTLLSTLPSLRLALVSLERQLHQNQHDYNALLSKSASLVSESAHCWAQSSSESI